MNSSYLILSISQDEYEQIKSKRQISVSNEGNITLKKGTIFLVYVREENKIYAEYDIEEYVEGSSMVQLEPIYNSPEGLEMTDLVMLTLPSYDLATWKQHLTSNIFGISETDYFEIQERMRN